MTESEDTIPELMATTSIELTNQDHVRAYRYALLAALLISPPTAKFMQQLTELEFYDLQEIDKQENIIWQKIKLATQSSNITTIEREFHHLFIGTGEGEVVPYRSWYLTGELMGKPLAALREELQHLGLARQESIHEPEDHIAILCEIMSLLIYNPTEYTEETQRHFFLVYLDNWVLHFFHDLHKAPSARFYQLVGQWGEQFFINERMRFN